MAISSSPFSGIRSDRCPSASRSATSRRAAHRPDRLPGDQPRHAAQQDDEGDRREAERALQEVEPVLLGLEAVQEEELVGAVDRHGHVLPDHDPGRRRRRRPAGSPRTASADRRPPSPAAAPRLTSGTSAWSDAAPGMNMSPPCCPGRAQQEHLAAGPTRRCAGRRATSCSSRCTSVPVVAVEESNVACACSVERALSWSTCSSRASNSPSAHAVAHVGADERRARRGRWPAST